MLLFNLIQILIKKQLYHIFIQHYTIQIIIPSFGLLHYSGIDKQLEHLIHIRSKGDKIIQSYSIERMIKLYKEKLVKLSYLSNPDEMLDLI